MSTDKSSPDSTEFPSTPSNRLYVITGGPGAGKTAIIDALRERGVLAMPEGGRAIIQDQNLIDGPGRPDRDVILFAEKLLTWHLYSYRIAAASEGRAVLFDRGIPDVIGLLANTGKEIPDQLVNASREFRYNKIVFFAAPWLDIYARDSERRESYADAIRRSECQAEAYLTCGYRLVEIPRGPVNTRAEWIMSQVQPRQP